MIKYVDDITAYSFDMVNCFERPVAILLENEKKNLGRLFLICNALAMSYYDENYIINNGICFESVDSILKITLRKDIVNNSLDMVIDKYVELGKAVLVPGNLKYLFYSEHFMGNDWKHLFLVTGINPVKKTVHIIDSEHVNYDNEKIIYKDFNLTQEILMECFEHYLWSDEEKYVYHFDYNEIDIIEKLKEILRILESKICSRNYSQDYLITTLNNSMEERDELEKLLINSAKYKFVLLYELVFVLKNYNIDTYNLTILNKKLYDVWSNKILGIVKRERKHNYANVVFKDIKEINNLEVELLGTVKKIHKCLENNLYCAEINEKSYFINNEDKIIKYDKGTVEFLFDTGKIYNSWKSDQCPQFIVKSGVNIKDHFCLECNCNKKFAPLLEGYQFGIYIKTLDEKKYLFGCDMLSQGIISILGVKEILKKELNLGDNKSLLKIEFIQNMIYFNVKNSNKNVAVGKIYINERICEIGLFCKTWGECKKLNIVYNNIKLQEF